MAVTMFCDCFSYNTLIHLEPGSTDSVGIKQKQPNRDNEVVQTHLLEIFLVTGIDKRA